MKKVAILLAAAITVCIIAALIAFFLIDLDKHKSYFLSRIKPYINRDIDFEHIDLTILSGLGLKIQDLRVADNPSFSQDNFLTLDNLYIKVRLLPLLKKEIQIKKLIMDKPVVRILRNKKGVFNFHDSMQTSEKTYPHNSSINFDFIKFATPRPAIAAQAAAGEKLQSTYTVPSILTGLLINDFEITQGLVFFHDATIVNQVTPMEVNSIDLKIKNLSFRKPFFIDLAANFFEKGKQNFFLSGYLGPLGKTITIGQIPIDCKLSVEDIHLAKISVPLPITIHSGQPQIVLKAKGSLGKTLSIESDIKLKELSFGERNDQDKPLLANKLSGNISGKVSISQAKQEFKIENITASINGNTFHLQGDIEDFLTRPHWNIYLSADKIFPDMIKATFPKYTSFLPEDLAMQGPASFRFKALGTKEHFSIETSMDAEPLTIRYKDLFSKDSSTPFSGLFKGEGSSESFTIQSMTFIFQNLVTKTTGKIENKQKKPFWINIATEIPDTPLEEIDSIVPLLTPYKLSGDMTIKNDLKGTLNNLEIAVYATSSQLNFAVPAQENKTEPKQGMLEDINLTFMGNKTDLFSGKGTLVTSKGLFSNIPFKSLKTQYSYDKGIMNINSFSLEIFKGMVGTSGSYDLTKATWSFSPNAKNVAIENILDDLTIYENIFSGTFSGSFDVQGNRENEKETTLFAKGSFVLSKGEWKNLNLIDTVLNNLFGLKMITSTIQELKAFETTTFDALEGSVSLTGNTMNLDTLILRNIRTPYSADSKADLKGTYRIDIDNLALNGTIILSPDDSRALVAKANLLKVLLDSQQRMVLPVTIRGSIKKPFPFLDTEYVLKKLASNYTRQGLDVIQKTLKLPKNQDGEAHPVEKLLQDLLRK